MYNFFCLHVCFHMCTVLADARRGHWIPLGLELQIVVSCMGARNQIFFKNKCS